MGQVLLKCLPVRSVGVPRFVGNQAIFVDVLLQQLIVRRVIDSIHRDLL